MATVLVVGGAGYIGSHMVDMLQQHGHHVIVLDNFSTGYRDALQNVELVEGSLGDANLLDKLFTQNKIDAVMHFAAFIEVGESVSKPAKYYQNNTIHTLELLNAMVRHEINKFIFSSTAAVYGMPVEVPIPETHVLNPINAYGRTKLAVEMILEDYRVAYGLNYSALRYFNAAGADPQCRFGERHDPESHLIPLILQAASGRRESISVFGRDYDTPDGTCIRDYVHVVDLCTAHELALTSLLAGKAGGIYNLGNGQGFSVQEVINVAKEVTGRDFTVIDGPRRPGDPARLVADSSKVKQELQWVPEFDALATMIEHAWQWELRHHCNKQD